MSTSMRELAGHHLVPPEKDFRWRGGEITRLEGFTDAVFAFAVTLLVVSLEVPRTFAELVTAMKGFAAFAICFTILVQFWYFHYKFSRRYGLQTVYTIVLTAALIFVVLFYVYPLKFLFILSVGALSGGLTMPREQLAQMVHTYHEISQLWLIYSAGVIAVYLIFMLLYHYAYTKRHELQLDEYETIVTRNSVIHFSGYVCIGVLVAIAALVLPDQYVGYAGFLFCLNAIWGWGAGSLLGRQQRLTLERMKRRTQASA